MHKFTWLLIFLSLGYNTQSFLFSLDDMCDEFCVDEYDFMCELFCESSESEESTTPTGTGSSTTTSTGTPSTTVSDLETPLSPSESETTSTTPPPPTKVTESGAEAKPPLPKLYDIVKQPLKHNTLFPFYLFHTNPCSSPREKDFLNNINVVLDVINNDSKPVIDLFSTKLCQVQAQTNEHP
ncbi:hypothetical protein FQA39_LY10135 [Lamprigera yunnana]|nr:hypothetical protein FQA39_LY10135 [Lamprigera yunnana]